MRAFTRSQLVRGAASLVCGLTVAAGVATVVHSSKAKVAEPTGQTSDGQTADQPPANGEEPHFLATTAVTDRAPGCAFPDDAELSYRLEGVVNVKMDSNLTPASSGPAGGPSATTSQQKAAVTLDLKAAKELVDKDTIGTVLVGKMRDVDDAIKETRGNVTSPFLLRVDPQCKIVAFARLASTPIREGRGEQALAYGLQWSWPTSAATTLSGPTAFAASRADTGENDYGAYRASSDEEHGPTLLVQRKIEAYTRVWSQEWMHGGLAMDVDANPGSGPEQKPIASNVTVDVGAGPWFASLHSSERLEVVGADVTTDLRVRGLVPLAGGHAFDGVPLDASKYVWQDLLPRHVHDGAGAVAAGAVKSDATSSPYHPVSLRRQVEAAKNLTLPQAMAKFNAGVAQHGTVADVWSGLETYLEAHPESAKTIASQIKSGEINNKTDAAVFIALGRTPNVEARDALLAMNSDTSLRPFDRARSAFALVARDDVGIELAQQLHSDSQAIATGATLQDRLYARHAALALGVMANLHADEHPEIVSEAKGAVTDILRNKDVHSIKPAFGTAANIGDSSMLGQFVPYMQHTDPEMRRSAAIVMRRMAPKDTTALATAWLARETDPDVKRELYRVVWLQHFDAHVVADRALLHQAIADLDKRPSGLTRASIIRLLAPAMGTYPEVRAALLASAPAEYAARKEGVYDLLSSYFTGQELTATLAASAGETGGN